MSIKKNRLTLIGSGVVDVNGNFYRYRGDYVSQSSLTLSPSSFNQRLFVHSITWSVRTIAADDGTQINLNTFVDNEQIVLGQVKVIPGIAQIVHVSTITDVLLDVSKGLEINVPAGTVTAYRCDVIYAEVDDTI